jgi:hypothetical protein
MAPEGASATTDRFLLYPSCDSMRSWAAHSRRSVIRTIHKAKLAAALSYPVGAEIISSALAAAPHRDRLELRSSDISPLRNTGNLPRSYPALHLQYINRPPSVSSPKDRLSDFLGEHWSLTVYPVRREQKFTVRQLLSSDGFPQLLTWLSKPRPPIWYSGCKRIEIIFDEDDSKLHFHQHESL